MLDWWSQELRRHFLTRQSFCFLGPDKRARPRWCAKSLKTEVCDTLPWMMSSLGCLLKRIHRVWCVAWILLSLTKFSVRLVCCSL